MTQFNIKLILHRKILSFNNLSRQQTPTYFISLFNYICLQFLHLHSMMHPNVAVDHSSKRTSPTNADTLHCSLHTHTRWSTTSIVSLGSSTSGLHTSNADSLTGLHTSNADSLTGLHTTTADFVTGLHTPMANTNFKLNCITTLTNINYNLF